VTAAAATAAAASSASPMSGSSATSPTGAPPVEELKRRARVAGLLYLALALTAPWGLVVVPSKLFVSGDAAATAERIRAGEGLLRLGIASELVHQVICVFLVLALERLLSHVHRGLARQVVILGALVSVPVVFVNVLNEVAAIALATGAPYLAPFDAAQRDALAYLFVRLHGEGIQVASVFWGLWLFPLGTLLLRSRLAPRFVGALLLVAGVSYCVTSFTSLVVPAWDDAATKYVGPLDIGELSVVVWLLVWGWTRPRAPTVAHTG
jgi:hypothetical protein